jgi:hypothetical protein
MAFKFETEVNIGPLLAALTCMVFVTLKVAGTMDWGWIWVLSPIWASPILFKGIIPGTGLIDAVIEVEYTESEQ